MATKAGFHEPDCTNCVYDTLSDCALCSDCGIYSQKVEYPAAVQARADAEIEELNQKLLSHAQNEHPKEYAELVEVLAREERLKKRVAGLELLVPSLPCCPDGFMDEPCTRLIEALVVVGAARRWRKPALSYTQRQLLDSALTKAVDVYLRETEEGTTCSPGS